MATQGMLRNAITQAGSAARTSRATATAFEEDAYELNISMDSLRAMVP